MYVVTTVEVQGYWPGVGDGTPPSGFVKFTPSIPNRSPLADTLLATAGKSVPLVDGRISIVLWATDDDEWAAAEWTWTVNETIGGVKREYNIEVLESDAPILQLADRVPVEAGSPVATYVTAADFQAHLAGHAVGAADTNYVHSQDLPSDTWTITHNLDKRPSVTLVDSAGTVMYADVSYVDDNSVTASFSVPVAGFAYVN